MKVIDFDQSYSPVLSSSTLRMIVTIAATYHLTIGIADVTNTLHNTSKDSYEQQIIDFPPHYLSWFKLHLPTICIEPSPYGRYKRRTDMVFMTLNLLDSSGIQYPTWSYNP